MWLWDQIFEPQPSLQGRVTFFVAQCHWDRALITCQWGSKGVIAGLLRASGDSGMEVETKRVDGKLSSSVNFGGDQQANPQPPHLLQKHIRMSPSLFTLASSSPEGWREAGGRVVSLLYSSYPPGCHRCQDTVAMSESGDLLGSLERHCRSSRQPSRAITTSGSGAK